MKIERPLPLPAAGNDGKKYPRGPLVLTLLASLALHGAALASFLASSDGPTVEVGTAYSIELVVLSSDAAPGSGTGSASQAQNAAAEETARSGRAAAPPAPSAPPVAGEPPPRPLLASRALPAAEARPQPAAPAETSEPTMAARSLQATRPAPVEEPIAYSASEVSPQSEPEPAPQSQSQSAHQLPPQKAALPQDWLQGQSASLPPARQSGSQAGPVSEEQGAEAQDGASAGSPGDSAHGASRAAAPAGRNAPPRYPNLARRKGQEGLVIVSVLISPGGLPETVTLAEASGHPLLDKAALEAVADWRFSPALERGRPVAAELRVPIRFKLTD